jgi:hypothetical protein
VSQSDVTDGSADQTRIRSGAGQVSPDGDGVAGARLQAGRQPTGDQVVDDVLGRLDAVASEPLDIQIEVGELVHDVLQGRLADLDQE